MANIDTYLENIMQARYGRDVRQSIHDGIEAINEDVENAVDIATQAKGEAKTAQDSAQAYANQALAHEQQAQIYRNQAEQFKDEAFSGTPEGYEDVVNKVNSLKEHTGTYLAEVGTHEGSALAKRIYGMSVQDGTPTPDSPVEIESAKADFRCTGKNLIPYPYYRGASYTSNGITYTANKDGTITANGTATNTSVYELRQGSPLLNSSTNLKIKTNKQLRMSGCPSGGGASTYNIQLSMTDGSNFWAKLRSDIGNGVTFDYIPSVGYYNICIIRIQIFSGQTVSNLVFHPMLTLADADQTYEPYQHKDATTNITLRSIEVASTDDYTYERDGKYYIADTIDWSEDRGYEIIRRVKEVTINSVVNVGSNPAYGMLSIYLISPDEFKLPSSNVRSNAIMTHFVTANYNEFINNDGTFYFNAASSRVYIRNNDMTSLADWNTWISENPVTFQGILMTPTTEPITSEQAQALLSLKTYDEATSITATSDIEPTIDIEYATSAMSAKALIGHNEGYIAQELESVYGVKNLIPYPYTEQNPNRLGITVTVNDDGSVTFNGTATATYQYVFQSTSAANLKLNKGNYILSGCPSGGANTGYSLKAVANSVTVTDIGDTKNISITQDNLIVGVYASINSGTVCNNLTFKPMLRPASIQSNEYQPYAMSNYELTKKIKELETALTELTSQ